ACRSRSPSTGWSAARAGKMCARTARCASSSCGPGRAATMLQAMAALARLSFRDEHVAQAPDRLDVERARWVGFDQLAQARDLHVERTVEHFVFASPGQFHQLFARQRLARMACKHLQHREFA